MSAALTALRFAGTASAPARIKPPSRTAIILQHLNGEDQTHVKSTHRLNQLRRHRMDLWILALLWNSEIQSHEVHTQALQSLEFLLVRVQEIQPLPNLVKQVRKVIMADHRHKS